MGKLTSRRPNPPATNVFAKTVNRIGYALFMYTREKGETKYASTPMFGGGNSDLSSKFSIALHGIDPISGDPPEEEIGANSGICFREVMRSIGVQRVDDILEVDYSQDGEDKPSRQLLARRIIRR